MEFAFVLVNAIAPTNTPNATVWFMFPKNSTLHILIRKMKRKPAFADRDYDIILISLTQHFPIFSL